MVLNTDEKSERWTELTVSGVGSPGELSDSDKPGKRSVLLKKE